MLYSAVTQYRERQSGRREHQRQQQMRDQTGIDHSRLCHAGLGVERGQAGLNWI